MRQADRPQVYTIDPHIAFVDALAQGLIDRAGGDTLALARMHILLPGRRAVRALTDAFVRLADGGLLLPRMTPVGDVDDDEALGTFADAYDSSGGDSGADLLPAMDPLRRRLLLAQLIRRWQDNRGAPITAVEALRLADQLGKALDAVLREGLAASALDMEIPAELAGHWQATLVFFRLVLDLWPPLLAAEGRSEAIPRANALLAQLTARWSATPPGPVIAAGIITAPPAVAALLAVVARLPQGMVVLPGLDTAMSDDEWDAIAAQAPGHDSESHPQYALKRLLDRMGVARGEVERWPASGATDGPAARTAAVARALRPAAFTGDWRNADTDDGLFDGVTLIEAADPAAEAQAIALALRRSLETPGQTAALVTPDRNLARRVAAHLVRWGIEIDDSAGTRLSVTPPGALLLALTEAAAQHFAPVALLAVLKHPLVMAGDSRLRWLDQVRRLDLELRGIRPAPGLAGVTDQIAEIDRKDTLGHRPPLLPWWSEVAAKLEPLATVFATQATTLPTLVAALQAAAEALAPGELWRGPAGRRLGELVAALAAQGDALAAFDPADAPALLGALLGEASVRPAYGRHPRLFIWGLIEARLQRADLMILAGLNEGVWPSPPAPDPWLAPAIRRELKLPGTETLIGMAAHDFVAGLGAPRVLLSRARRDDSGPTVASRLWLRLRALAGDAIRPDETLLALARAIDAPPQVVPAPRPAPAPAASLRPRRLSVTEVDKLRADPFSFYAQRMLKLEPLDPLDADPTGADRGTAVHAILEHWVQGGKIDPAELTRLTEIELAKWEHHPLMRALWAPRVHRAMGWVIDAMRDWETEGWQPRRAEAKGEFDFGNGVLLRGRADRIDRNTDGALAIIDYKTGSVPSHAQVIGGFALQMGLLGALAEQGVLQGVPAAPVAALRYWKLTGGKDAGKASDPLSYNRKADMTAGEHIAQAMAVYRKLCADYLLGLEPFTAKLHPDHGEKYRDFDHFARVAEWLGKPGT